MDKRQKNNLMTTITLMAIILMLLNMINNTI